MRIAVVGGGMAGLAAAHALLTRGAEPVVFEEALAAGGKVGSRSEGGYLTEDGPHFVARPLDALLAALGLRGEVVLPQGPRTRFVHLGGRVSPAPGLALLARAGGLRALLEPLVARPLREDVSLADLLTARFGVKAGGLLASLLAAGVYAGDPARLSAREAFPALGAAAGKGSLLRHARGSPRPAIWALRPGMGALPAALCRALGTRVRLGARVLDLAPGPGATAAGPGRGWTIAHAGGSEEFDGLVLAVPGAAAAALLPPGRGGAGLRAAHAALESVAAGVEPAPVALVHLGFASERPPRGFGLLDADGALHAIGTLFPSSMLPGRAPPGRALFTCICGGARRPERARLPDAALVAAVLGDLRRTLGLRGEPEYVRVVRWEAAIPQVTPGHGARVAAARAALAGLPPLALAGASYDGVSVPDVVRSGEAAAALLLGRG